MQLSSDILDAIASYTKDLKHPVSLTLSSQHHEKKDSVQRFANNVVKASDTLRLNQQTSDNLPPLGIELSSPARTGKIIFNGIPGGHEFNSFVLAILHIGGHPLKLDPGIQQLVSTIEEPMHFDVYVSLSCHNCPDVVQTLNQFAILNSNIHVETIDGGVNQARIEENDIQGVPSVYLNGKPFATGKVEPSTLVEKLKPYLNQSKQSDSLPEQDVTVLGGGPSGVAAAIYAARKGLKVTLVAKRLGGQVKDTQGIENFISVPYTTGSTLSDNLADHLSKYDITLKENVAVDAITKGSPFNVTLNTGENFASKTVIVATGAQWRKLNIPGEEEYTGSGVAYCPHCDGPFYKGKDVAVIGGGNSGIEAALDLAGIVKSVTVIEFADTLKADDVLVSKAKNTSNITILTNTLSKSVEGNGTNVTGLAIEDRATKETSVLPLSGIFVQIGLLPNSHIMNGVVDINQQGEIIIDDKCRTSVPGIFASGDVTTTPYKQIVIAGGEGAKAALSAFEYLL